MAPLRLALRTLADADVTQDSTEAHTGLISTLNQALLRHKCPETLRSHNLFWLIRFSHCP